MFLALSSCSCGSSRHGQFRIGVDADWYPLDFEALQPYVNGYTEDLLLEIAQYSGVEFVKVPASWSSLLEGLNSRKYEAILTSIPPYNFNAAKYDFSKNFLELGPVLVIPVDADVTDLAQMSNEVVGVVSGDPALLILQKYPEIVVRKYETVPDALDAVVNGSVEAVLLDRLIAMSYVRDLFATKLKISTDPFTDAGLHLVTLKGNQEHLIHLFNKSLSQFKKKKKLQSLQKKWQLDS